MPDPIQDALLIEDLPDLGAVGFVAEIWEALNRAPSLPSHNARGAAVRIAALSVRLANAIRAQQNQAIPAEDTWAALTEEVASEKARRGPSEPTGNDSWAARRPEIERLLQEILRSLDRLYVQRQAVPDTAVRAIMVGAAAILVAEHEELSQ
jgi:hypothetical protein